MYEKIKAAWIQKVQEADFPGKEIIIDQMIHAKMSVEEGFAYVFLEFRVDDSVLKFPDIVRVPIEMRLDRDDGVPIYFLLHIVHGVVCELEIYTADSSYLDLGAVCIEEGSLTVNEDYLLGLPKKVGKTEKHGQDE